MDSLAERSDIEGGNSLDQSDRTDRDQIFEFFTGFPDIFLQHGRPDEGYVQ